VRSRPLALLLALGAGCGGDARTDEAPPAPSSAPPAVASTPPAPASAAAPPGVAPESVDLDLVDEPPDPLAAVSRRAAVIEGPEGDLALRASADVFAAHYGGPVPYPLALRVAPLPAGRRALLFTSTSPQVKPLVVVVDGAGNVIWQKARPLAGTHERWRWLTLTAGPEGSVLVYWWDEASRAVAARRWRHDGGIFADFHLFDVDDPSALDAVWWPGHGFVVTTVAKQRARSALLGEDGFRRFGDGMIEVGRPLEVGPAIAVAAGADGVFYAFHSPGPSGRLWVDFYREDGTSPWRGPLDLGAPRLAGETLARGPSIELLTPTSARVSAGVSHVVRSDGTMARGSSR
jgi:hypothetical protein